METVELIRTEGVTLPPPKMTGGKPLMEALRLRQSTREYSDRPLSHQVLSNVLWAAFGINREKTGGRTAPSARNWQEISVYVALRDGLFVYEPRKHHLMPVLGREVRALTGMQDFVAKAPVNLVYVADLSKIDAPTADERRFYTAADAGFIAQNVYLVCASEGLATVVRGLVDRKGFAKAAALAPTQRVLLAQTVGYAS